MKISLDLGSGSNLYTFAVSDQPVKKTFLRSGELAQAAGVSRDTLRHYEKKGVLRRPRRTAGGYRLYPVEAIERVRLIRRALAVGFTLDELARLLAVRDGGGAPCRQAKGLAEAKLADLEARLAEMLALREALRHMLDDWEARLAATAAGERTALLESLAGMKLPAGDLDNRNVASPWHKKQKSKGREDE